MEKLDAGIIKIVSKDFGRGVRVSDDGRPQEARPNLFIEFLFSDSHVSNYPQHFTDFLVIHPIRMDWRFGADIPAALVRGKGVPRNPPQLLTGNVTRVAPALW